MTLRRYRGHLHLHSLWSDGTLPMPEIISHAREAGLDFLCPTDHQTLAARTLAGWHGNLLLIPGMEINDRGHHVLAFGLEKEIPANEFDPQCVVDQVQEQKGTCFIAHPHDRTCRLLPGFEGCPWTDWNVQGYAGIEIWNYMSAWKGEASSFASALKHYLHPTLTMPGPYPETLARWDEQARRRKVVAVGGSDAHGRSYRYAGLDFSVFPYPHLLRTINMHVLLPESLASESSVAQSQILKALAEGSSFVAHDHIDDPSNFEFFGVDTGDVRVDMGTEMLWKNDFELIARIDKRSRIRLIRDGVEFAEGKGGVLRCRTAGPGVYRVEVYRRSRFGNEYPWIFSNPLFLRSSSEK